MEKQAVLSNITDALKTSLGVSVDTAKTIAMVGLPLAVAVPILTGYALGKSRKELKDLGKPSADFAQREALKKKYDDTIRDIATKRGLVDQLAREDEVTQ